MVFGNICVIFPVFIKDYNPTVSKVDEQIPILRLNNGLEGQTLRRQTEALYLTTLETRCIGGDLRKIESIEGGPEDVRL